MSPVPCLVLLLAFSYVSTSALPDAEKILPIPVFDFEKPGTCPADVDYPRCDNPAIHYLPDCNQDQDCEGEKKCCFSGCKNRCLLPLQVKKDSCPYFNHSICVHVRPSPSECHSDDQCQGTDRCCCSGCNRRCVPTVTVKPGQCPAPKKTCFKIDSAQCKTDSSCTRNKKCCDRCGLKCVTPEQEHDGVCPTSIENLSCLTFYKALCNRDSDCPRKQKCCLSDNTLQCQAVKNEKPGSCPIPSTRCKTPLPAPLCTSDRVCPGDKKCCTPLCTQECTDPLIEMKIPISLP
ncbi:WAP four-disulfide core domain protein 3-like isoform X1 [Bufo bufo]|uniref:WAP four-disulfide core domain protein 3-like isoform X1 n=1 Tax=Bufo bufo TaxID=8384 RepID=UPI001ABDDE4C|nr:WAP four-disulfide core domain protein 3-like isoform X1 [Bufo bufo]